MMNQVWRGWLVCGATDGGASEVKFVQRLMTFERGESQIDAPDCHRARHLANIRLRRLQAPPPRRQRRPRKQQFLCPAPFALQQ